MAVIRIGGVGLPAPDVCVVGFEAIGSFERNANGNMAGDLVAMKRKLTVGWQMLDDESFKAVLAQSEPFFVDVEYCDPKDGRVVKQMYVQPGGGKVALVDGRTWWRDVRCVFVER